MNKTYILFYCFLGISALLHSQEIVPITKSMAISKFSQNMRVVHRYLGFFLAGIMAMYALSGIVLIFRDTDFLKKEIEVNKTLASNLNAENLGKELKIKNFKLDKTEGDLLVFKNGTYNASSGEAVLLRRNCRWCSIK